LRSAKLGVTFYNHRWQPTKGTCASIVYPRAMQMIHCPQNCPLTSKVVLRSRITRHRGRNLAPKRCKEGGSQELQVQSLWQCSSNRRLRLLHRRLSRRGTLVSRQLHNNWLHINRLHLYH
jgi:hypothetical protein